MGLSVTRALLAVLLVLAMPGTAAAAPDPPDPGQTETGSVTSRGSEFPYLLYTPTTYDRARPAPLVVVVHGCQTTAETELKVTRFNQLAEREGFVVLYPEVDAIGRNLPGPLNHCWKFFDPTTYFRGHSDLAAIAAMTREVMSELTVDEERVYLIGVSAGGLMTAAGAAAYSDVYAAVGIVASAGYADGTCFATGLGTPTPANALLAFAQMQQRARVVPIIAIGSDADLAFPAACTDKALEQSLRTNNMVLSGNQSAPLALTPAAVRELQVPGGLAYTVSDYRDPDGCLVGEKWIIHGMPHAWPGGTTDERYRGYTDVRAPSGADATWSFVKRYRRSDTGLPCAEIPLSAAARHSCRARTVTITVKRGRRQGQSRSMVPRRRLPRC